VGTGCTFSARDRLLVVAYSRRTGPRLDGYIGEHVFEVVCHQFVASSPLRLSALREWARGGRRDASDEVDVVGVDGSSGVLFGECKWGLVAREELQKLERRVNLILPNLERRDTVGTKPGAAEVSWMGECPREPPAAARPSMGCPLDLLPENASGPLGDVADVRAARVPLTSLEEVVDLRAHGSRQFGLQLLQHHVDGLVGLAL
jgi:hypothetical protein